ncbi:MAG: D-alanyl-D-alanine carboxypeptidase [Pseudomonadota bacterium]|jgi:hypothetical protein
MSRFRSDEITLLLPSFQPYVQAVLDDMTAQGFKPILFDGLRTPAEALRNAKRGTGKVQSPHLYGLAADVICDDHGWSCREKKCKFYAKLVAAVRSRGLITGADFHNAQGKPMVDEPHFQGLPPAQERKVRELGMSDESIPERDAIVAAWLKQHAKL